MTNRLMILALSVLLALNIASAAHAEPQKIGVVGNIDGVVTATDANGDVRTLKAGDDIYLNDAIASNAKAKAQIMFLDKSAMMVNPNTNVVVDRFVYDPATASGQLSLQNAKGALRFIGGALTKQKPVVIKTPVATIGIRGGIADTFVAANGKTEAIFVFGKEMTASSGGQTQSFTTPGQGSLINGAGSIPTILPPERVAALSGIFSDTLAGDNGPKVKNPKLKAPHARNGAGGPKGPRGPKNVHVGIHNATQDNQREEGQTTYNNIPFNPSDFGTYAVSGAAGHVISAGRSEMVRTDDGRLVGRLVQGYPHPTNGPQIHAALPWLAGSGYQNIEGAIVGDRSMSGDGYRTDDDAMQFYDLTDGGLTLRTVVGQMADASTWATSAAASASHTPNTQNGISFYDFLPDLVGFVAGLDNFFGYNMASDSFASGGGVDNSHAGLMVNWNTGRFLTGHIEWGSGTGLNRGVRLAFGKTLAGGRLLDGRVYEYVNGNFGGGTTLFSDSGFLRTTQAYAANPGDAFSGMMLEGIMNDSGVFHPGTSGPRIFQGAVQGDINSDVVNSATDSTGDVQKGYAAGFLATQHPNGTITYRRVANEDFNNVDINPNSANGTVAAKLYLNNTENSDEYVDARFGNHGGSTGASAYLTDELYAAEQSVYTVGDGTGSQTYTGQAANGGVLVAGNLIAGVDNECSACEHVTWGVWAGDLDRSTSNVEIHDIAAMIPYVAGDITPKVNLPTMMGEVDYTGVMYGSVLQGGALSMAEGNFVAAINLDNRTMEGFNANFAGMNFGVQGTSITMDIGPNSTFSNIAVGGLGGANAAAINGTINGALFGPSGQDIGGNFSVSNSATGADAAGVYIGTRE